MMRIFLVRHGKSQANENKLLHTTMADHAIPLSDLGREQALRAGDFLASYIKNRMTCAPRYLNQYIMPDSHIRMWVSPYQRTRETADGIQSKMRGLITDRKENIHLVEQQFGLFDGLSHEGFDSVLEQRFPHEFAFYKKCEDHNGKFWARMPLGESRFDVALRVHQCFGTFHRDFQKHGIENLVIVAHGLSIRAFVMQWLNLPVEWFENEPNPENCSIRLIEGNEDKGYIYDGGGYCLSNS